MNSVMRRLAIVSGLFGLTFLAAGCDTEPTGSCITTSYGYVSDDPSTSETNEVCQSNSTESACAQSGGTFAEGSNCILFDLFHPPT
jgi:hypothetical protein